MINSVRINSIKETRMESQVQLKNYLFQFSFVVLLIASFGLGINMFYATIKSVEIVIFCALLLGLVYFYVKIRTTYKGIQSMSFQIKKMESKTSEKNLNKTFRKMKNFNQINQNTIEN